MSVISANDPLGLGAIKPVIAKPAGASPATVRPAAAERDTTEAVARSGDVAATETKRAAAVGNEEFQAALATLSRAVEARAPSELEFEVDKDTGRTIVRIVDASTGETIRQIPPEELIEIAKSIDQMQGLLLRQEA